MKCAEDRICSVVAMDGLYVGELLAFFFVRDKFDRRRCEFAAAVTRVEDYPLTGSRVGSSVLLLNIKLPV